MSRQLRTAHFAEEALIKLFNDCNDEVRSEAAQCFSRFEGTQLEEFEHLSRAVCFQRCLPAELLLTLLNGLGRVHRQAS